MGIYLVQEEGGPGWRWGKGGNAGTTVLAEIIKIKINKLKK